MGRRCAREGCRAWALRGGARCRAHTPRDEDDAADQPASLREWVEARPGAESGNYRNLLGPELARLLEEAGRDGSLTEEIGALRVAMKRLLDDNTVDSRQLAEGLARIVGATLRALQARRTIAGEAANDLMAVMKRVLQEKGL